MRIILLSLFLTTTVCATVQPCFGQEAESEVRAVLQRLFDGMRAGDSTAVRSVFHPEARLMSVAERDGQSALAGSPIDAFVEAVGQPHESVWDERIQNLEIRVDGGLADAWMDYAFYLGGRLSHCGVNAMHLFREPQGWKIIHITDTRRRDCASWPDR